MSFKLNNPEMQQFNDLVNAIRSDVPYNPQPARNYISLVRGRVCVALNQQIDAGIITDICVDRTKEVDQYYHR